MNGGRFRWRGRWEKNMRGRWERKMGEGDGRGGEGKREHGQGNGEFPKHTQLPNYC
jgi:hypothetical protein